MGVGKPAESDDWLWISLAACPARDFLVGNCHTFPGRMAAYCPHRDQGFCVSLAEIEEMSPEAERWVRGFLAGNEPEPEHMFGPSIHDATDSDDRWPRWREAVANFRRTGDWEPEPWRELAVLPPDASFTVQPWTVIADELRQWNGIDWHCKAPGPARERTLLLGSVCHERRHHDLTVLAEGGAICDDCGYYAP